MSCRRGEDLPAAAVRKPPEYAREIGETPPVKRQRESYEIESSPSEP
jgi:hypothetical protein